MLRKYTHILLLQLIALLIVCLPAQNCCAYTTITKEEAGCCSKKAQKCCEESYNSLTNPFYVKDSSIDTKFTNYGQLLLPVQVSVNDPLIASILRRSNLPYKVPLITKDRNILLRVLRI